MSVETNITPTSRGQLAHDASRPGGLGDSLFQRVRNRWQRTVETARNVREAVGGSAPTFKPDSFNRELSPDDWRITSQENELIEACTAKVLEELNQALEGTQGYVTLSWESKDGHTTAIFRDPIALMGRGRAAAVAELNKVVGDLIGEYSVRAFGGWDAPGRTLDNRDNQLQPTISERIFDDGSDYIRTIRIASLTKPTTKPTNIAVIKSWFRSPVTLRIDIIPKDNLGAYNQYDSPYRDQIPQAALMDSAVADDEDVTVEAAPVIDFMPEATKLIVKWLKDSRKVLSRETDRAQALEGRAAVSPYLERFLIAECTQLEDALLKTHGLEPNETTMAAEAIFLRLVAIFKSLTTREGRNTLKRLGIPVSNDMVEALRKLLPLTDTDKQILVTAKPTQLEKLLETDIPKSLAYWLKTRTQEVTSAKVAAYLELPLIITNAELSEAEQHEQLTERQAYLFPPNGEYTYKTNWGYKTKTVPSETEILAIYEASTEAFFPLDTTTTVTQLDAWKHQLADYSTAKKYLGETAKKADAEQQLQMLTDQIKQLIDRTITEPDVQQELELTAIAWAEPIAALELFGKIRQKREASLRTIIISSGGNVRAKESLEKTVTELFTILDSDDVKNLLSVAKSDPLPREFDDRFWEFIPKDTITQFLMFWQTNSQSLQSPLRKKALVESFLSQRQKLLTEHDTYYRLHLETLVATIEQTKVMFKQVLIVKLKEKSVDHPAARAQAIMNQINTENLLEIALRIQANVGWEDPNSIAAINLKTKTAVTQTLRQSGMNDMLQLAWYGPDQMQTFEEARVAERDAKHKKDSLKLIAQPPEVPKAQTIQTKATPLGATTQQPQTATRPGVSSAIPNPFFRRPEAMVVHTPTIDVLPDDIDDGDSEDAPVSLFKRLTSPTTAPTATTTETTPRQDLENEFKEYFRQQAEARQRTAQRMEQAYFGDADEFDDDAPPLTPEQLAQIKAYAISENTAVAERAKLAKDT